MTDQEINVKIIQQITQALQSIISKQFGPNALNSMLCASNGKLIISNSGMSIMKALNFAHPVSRLIIACVSTHHDMYGDGSKTLILWLNAVFHKLTGYSASEKNKLYHGFQAITNEIVPNIIIPHLIKACVKYDTEKIDSVKKACGGLLKHALEGKLNKTSKTLIEQVISDSLAKATSFSHLASTVDSYLKYFDLLCIENPGQPIACSKCLNCVILQRDFTVFCPLKKKSVKVVNIDFPLEEDLASDIEFQIKEECQIHNLNKIHLKSVTKIVHALKRSDIDLVLLSCGLKQLSCDIFQNSGISVISHVDKEDVDRLVSITGKMPIKEGTAILEESLNLHTWTLSKCERRIFARRKCVLMEDFETDSPIANQIVVAAPTNGLAAHIKQCVQDCLKVLKVTLDFTVGMKFSDMYSSTSGTTTQVTAEKNIFVIPGGGSFELLVHEILQHYSCQIKNKSSMYDCCNILKDALLSVPLQLVENSYTCQTQRLSLVDVKNALKNNRGRIVAINARTGSQIKVYKYQTCFDLNRTCTTETDNKHRSAKNDSDTEDCESIAGKIRLLQSTLQLITQLLKLDGIIGVQGLSSKKTSD